MKLSFKFKPNFTVEQLKIIEELSYHTTKLYNVANYDLKENGFKSYVDMAIDLGLDNLATLTFKENQNSYLFCDKKLKSVNSYINKRIAELQSIEMKKCGSDKFKNTKEIKGFVQIPIQRLAELIEYKAKLQGIKVKYKEESYTSGCSAFDLEPITKKNYDKTRRVVRGLFKSSYGFVNSDINGSLNILRKEEKCIPKLVETMRDKGKCSRPLRIRVAC